MRLALFHAATIPAAELPTSFPSKVESKPGGWFIAPAGRPLREAVAQRVSAFYADHAAAERALREKQAEYDAAERERDEAAGWCHVCNRDIRSVGDHAPGCEQSDLGPEDPAIAAPRPYLCTVVLRMPADDGHSLRPEEVTEFLTENGGHVLEWHDEDLIGAAEREDEQNERRDIARKLVETSAEAHRLSVALAHLSPLSVVPVRAAGEQLGLAAAEILKTSEARS